VTCTILYYVRSSLAHFAALVEDLSDHGELFLGVAELERDGLPDAGAAVGTVVVIVIAERAHDQNE
jgi:hypothetical protein